MFHYLYDIAKAIKSIPIAKLNVHKRVFLPNSKIVIPLLYYSVR